MKQIRINKYLAKLGLASRRQVDEFIEQGLVKVNDQPAELGMKIDPSQDTIEFKGKKFPKAEQPEKKEYWKLYKPVGVVSTTDDPRDRRVVTDLVKTDSRIYPVGRLDMESEGLLLLTNDGQLTYKLTHPKYEIEKEYHVWFEGDLTANDIKLMRQGMMLTDGMTAPARVQPAWQRDNSGMFKIILTEGRNREIRRMSARVGVTVTRLKRVRMASLQLGELEPGEAVELTQRELDELNEAVSA